MQRDQKQELLEKLLDDEARYHVVPWSESAHCCFDATVVDTSAQTSYSTHDYLVFKSLCECFTMSDANLIAKVLNRS